MNEHKKLYEICKMIGYEISTNFKVKDDGIYVYDVGYIHKYEDIDTFDRDLNVREIIFTKDFMDKYNKFLLDKDGLSVYGKGKNSRLSEVLDNLDNPVDYLFNLIF